MRNNLIKSIVFALAALSIFIPARAPADGSDGFSQMFDAFFGTAAAQSGHATCNVVSGDTSILGGINELFCHLEKDMAITGVGSATINDGGTFIHAEVTGSEGGGTITADNAVNYDFLANVWVCTASCGSTANFSRVISLAWSYKTDKTINKGYLVEDAGSLDGSAGSAGMSIAYDVGSLTTTKTITAKESFSFGGQTGRNLFVGTKTGSVMSLVGLQVTGASATAANSMRFMARIDTNANTASAFFEAAGASGAGAANMISGDLSDTSSTPTPICLNRSLAGSDWTYSVAGGSCTVPSWPSNSLNAVGAYTANGLAGSWNSAPVHPSSL